MGNRYQRLGILGEGSYGVVYKARCTKTKDIVAIKDVRMPPGMYGLHPTSIREITILKELSTLPHFVKLLNVMMPPKKLLLVFEYLPMDLKQFIDNHRGNRQIEIGTIKSLMHQLLTGISHCHERRIMHRDIKPENILVENGSILKIADFGSARIIHFPVRNHTPEVVTLCYRAPELLLGSVYCFPLDIWSVGCVMAELITKKILFPGDSQIDTLFLIFNTLGTPTEEIWPGVTQLQHYQCEFPTWKQNVLHDNVQRLRDDSHGLDLLNKLLTLNPIARITAKEAIKHPFLVGVDDSAQPEPEPANEPTVGNLKITEGGNEATVVNLKVTKSATCSNCYPQTQLASSHLNPDINESIRYNRYTI